WAAITRETAKLADWGTLSVAGNISTPGFGSLETTVGNLSRETDAGYTLATNLEMGRLLPPELNLSIPTYYSFGQQYVIPEYNPLDPDILLTQSLSNLSKPDQNSLNDEVLTKTTQKSLNFTNVHFNKNKNQKKSHFYDIQNFSATYAYTEMDHSDINTIHAMTKDYKGILSYTYSFHPKAIQPLIKSEFFKKSKYLALIRDFNFYPMPDKVSVSANLDRGYNDFQMRVIIPGAEFPPLPDNVSKTFNVMRNYNFTFPLTKSLKFDYTAVNDSRVLEPEGRPISTQQDRDSVKQAFLNRQVNTDFKQTENLTYDIPINKIPLFDFVTANARYTANYEWMHAPFAQENLGSTIQNSNTRQVNGQLNMTMLYNKVPFLKKYLQDDNKKPAPGNRQIPGKGGPMNKNQQQQPGQNQKQPDEVNDSSLAYKITKYIVHVVTSVKNVSFTYSDNEGLVLPGYSDSTRFFGMDDRNGWKPGPTFVFGGGQKMVPYPFPIRTTNGLQKNFPIPEFIAQALTNHWLDTTNSFYTPFTTVSTQTFSFRATLEPIPDFKIDLTATHTNSKTTSQYLHDSIGNDHITHYPSISSYTEAGNFSMSYFMLPTIFKGNTAPDQQLFQAYLSNRTTISRRLGTAPGSQSHGLVTNHDTA
ncbi:MAG TPA: cell surface protein SprA, partial [Bacteroidia bacterium]|nr:cell surface protein SprA [Bacteroidia bacterium]